MNPYDLILGHRGPIGQLERARQAGRVAHAYLFHGPDGVGKQRVALAFAAALNCRAAEAPCGSCSDCQKIAEYRHPDVQMLASESYLVAQSRLTLERGTPSDQIKVDQLTELQTLLHHRPYLGRTKVVVVVDAERMNESTQNRFLKTLEEPSADTVILLLTAHPDLLLGTIRSRCQALGFGPLPQDLLAAHLERTGIDPARAKTLAAMSQGSLGRALALVDEDHLRGRDEALEGLERAFGGDLADVIAWAEATTEGQGRTQLLGAVDALELWLRDQLLQSVGVSDELLITRDRAVPAPDRAEPRGALIRRIERLRAVRGAIARYQNPRMVAEAVLLDMKDTRT